MIGVIAGVVLAFCISKCNSKAYVRNNPPEFIYESLPGTIPVGRSLVFLPESALDDRSIVIAGLSWLGAMAFVGGVETIRAFREDRFAGSASAYGNAELRVFVTKLSLLLPTDFGLFGFTDWGRVFLKGEESGKWHAAVGGGIWFAPVRPSNTFSIALATSEERTSLYIGTGFHF